MKKIEINRATGRLFQTRLEENERNKERIYLTLQGFMQNSDDLILKEHLSEHPLFLTFLDDRFPDGIPNISFSENFAQRVLDSEKYAEILGKEQLGLYRTYLKKNKNSDSEEIKSLERYLASDPIFIKLCFEIEKDELKERELIEELKSDVEELRNIKEKIKSLGKVFTPIVNKRSEFGEKISVPSISKGLDGFVSDLINFSCSDKLIKSILSGIDLSPEYYYLCAFGFDMSGNFSVFSARVEIDSESDDGSIQIEEGSSNIKDQSIQAIYNKTEEEIVKFVHEYFPEKCALSDKIAFDAGDVGGR